VKGSFFGEEFLSCRNHTRQIEVVDAKKGYFGLWI
jgi:hypothetical protein